jgi:hypothetical protein
MKKALYVVLACVILVSGCASAQKKFTRKKKEKRVPTAIFIDEGPYQKQFSNEYYYQNHYTLWKSWHDELLSQLGGNQKKVKRCANEAYNHLSDLGNYLKPEKRAELKPLVDDLAKIVQRIENANYSKSDEGGMRVELEKIRRLVANDFYYNKVKEHVLPDNVDLGQGSSVAAPA